VFIVHAQLAARGLTSEAHAATALATMYARCRRPADAHRVFDRMPVRNRVAWDALVAGYALVRMQEEGGERSDAVTLIFVLTVCRALCPGLHAFALRAGFHGPVNVSTVILHAWQRCRSMGSSGTLMKLLVYFISLSQRECHD
jgi:pentatricopeptide repeat protein